MTQKEAKEILREVHENSVFSVRTALEVFFPEFKESEDERIRKHLISLVKNWDKDGIVSKYTSNANDIKQILAWLENQGKQKPPVIDFKAKNWYVSKVDGKIYDMTYNPTDNIEPKFKVGDWIAWEELNTAKIVNIDGDRYEVEFIDGNKGFPHIDYIDRLFHLWTIQDARDGDVLYSPCCKLSWIYKDEKTCYVGYNPNYNSGSIVINKPVCIPTDVIPATKEQRDLLFQKMKQAGYEWDGIDRELKKEDKK